MPKPEANSPSTQEDTRKLASAADSSVHRQSSAPCAEDYGAPRHFDSELDDSAGLEEPEGPHAPGAGEGPAPAGAGLETTPTAEAEAEASQPSKNQALDQGQLADVWKLLRASIRKRIQPEQFETWFRRADLQSVEQRHICIAVQNGFSRDWLHTYYREVIEEAAYKVLSRKLRVEFIVDPELTTHSPSIESAAQERDRDQRESGPAGTRGVRGSADSRLDSLSAGAHRNGNRAPGAVEGAESSHIGQGSTGGLVRGSDIGLNPRYTFENFVVGPCNRFCHAVSLGTAEAPGKTYNPLFLHGNVGLGKTHLLQAICYSMIENWPDVRILFLSCETFVNHFISALENGDLQRFRGKYRNVDVLVVDDIHLLANKERTQEEFFHTFNSLYNAGKQIILSSDSPPKDIPTLQDRMVSRFKWGLVTEIEPPCYETRMAILKRKGRNRGQELPEEVAQIIAERIDTNIRELEGTVNKLYSFSNVTGQAITVEFAREVLTELFTKRRGQPAMEDIIEVVTAHFGVKLSDMQSKKRTNQIAFPRQIAMYLARKITRHSLEEIGGFFGGRDHSTVLHAVRKITRLVQDDSTTRDVIVGFLEDLQTTGQ